MRLATLLLLFPLVALSFPMAAVNPRSSEELEKFGKPYEWYVITNAKYGEVSGALRDTGKKLYDEWKAKTPSGDYARFLELAREGLL